MWAIIGGSGFEQFSDVVNLGELPRETPFGQASSGFRKIKIQNTECLFMSRHGTHHEFLPSEVNYRANIFAFKKFGATKVLSLSAVGSLRKELAPLDMVMPSQYIDRTKGVRASSFGGNGLVAHVSLAEPTWAKGTEWISSIAHEFDFKIHANKISVCVEGPYFSTKAESHAHRAMGADIIGMTAFPEYALAREAGLSFLPCSFVTDYDSWDDTREPVTVEEVMRVMKQNNQSAFKLITRVISSDLQADPEITNRGLKTGIMASYGLTPAQEDWLKVVRG